MKKSAAVKLPADPVEYRGLLTGIGELLETARHASARVVNAVITATYWEIGRRIVEFQQGGRKRAKYGEELLDRLSSDLMARFGRGFSRQNLQRIREFYLEYSPPEIRSTLSSKSKAGIRSTLSSASSAFPLPWSHYVRLLGVRSPQARRFYEVEALRGGWSVRQLDRQIGSPFYERTVLSRDKAAMLRKGAKPLTGEALNAEEEIRDPLVLEFLNLKDEYSETELEEGLIRHLDSFLLELGHDFTFVGRQRRLRVGDEWYRIDLLFFRRRLRCLVVIDLKLGRFNQADAGQMRLYLNYAREHWTHPGENPPVGLLLCSAADQAFVHYTLDNLPSKVLAREYRVALPSRKRIAAEIEKPRQALERRLRG